MNKILNPTTGADVEVFVKHKLTGEIVSAEGMVQGTKEQPYVFDAQNPHFATSLDNVLAEFGIPPASNKQEFYNYLRKSLGYINRSLPEEYCTAVHPAFMLDAKWLQTKQAREFGCEPDYDAYTGHENPRPKNVDLHLRTAGGHVHLGYQTPSFVYNSAEYRGKNKRQYYGDPERCTLVKALDLFVGVPGVLQEPKNARKELYGKAGCFRPKEYGLEYRTISNYYLKSRKLTYWVYDAVMAAVDWYNAGNTVPHDYEYYIQNAINFCDKTLASELIEDFKLKVA